MKPVLAMLLAACAFAQSSSTYDASRPVRLTGVVTRVEWANPHAFFFLDVRDAGRAITNWAVEFGNPLDLEKNGWTRNSLHIGDSVNVLGIRSSNLRQALKPLCRVGDSGEKWQETIRRVRGEAGLRCRA